MATENHTETKFNLKSPEYYFNRELSFLEFNKRVLAEAESPEHPLLERLKFISIYSSNLDEFFMIRVAGLRDQIQAGVIDLSSDGMTPGQQLKEIRKRLLVEYARQEKILMKDIFPALEQEGIFFHSLRNLRKSEKDFLKDYFCNFLLPVLTPLSLDPAHPFPRIINRSLNVAFSLIDKQKKTFEKRLAILQLSSQLTRFIEIPRDDGKYHFVRLEQVVKAYASILFPGLEVEFANTFRVTRDADIEISEDEAEDLLLEISEQVKHRKWETAAVRLEVSDDMPAYMVTSLMKSLDLQPDDVYSHNRPLHLPDLLQLLKLDIRHLKDTPFQTRTPKEFLKDGAELFDVLRKKDILVHHPFDSFTNSVLKFLSTAATCPDVVAIKITLYRAGMNSPIVAALKQAAENGKQVTAFVELKARFDEENNIIWAKELEDVGVYVVYGVLGLKTHCKIAMVVRREGKTLRTYLHLSTGNYNRSTSRLYTDIGFFTANEEYAIDAIHLFNFLTGYSYHKDWNHLIVAPNHLRKKIVELIDREAALHTPENPGFIFAKMNAIAHDEVTQALYRASQKGVKIQLVVRGICCLKPGIPGVSENIEVRSILGRFLEHSRIFYFQNAGESEMYLSSADWMTRNLHRRVELMFPILDSHLKKNLFDLLQLYWLDNKKSWKLLSSGTYEKLQPQKDEEPFSIQDHLINEVRKYKKKKQKVSPYIKNLS